MQDKICYFGLKKLHIYMTILFIMINEHVKHKQTYIFIDKEI